MNCIFCNSELYADESYVTDGKICVCNMCASRHTLYETAIFVANHFIESNIIRHDSDVLVIEPDDGLTGQTNADGENEILSDIENMSHDDFFSKYADDPDALSAYIDANGEPDCLAGQNCPLNPCDNCHFYNGELNLCTISEEGVNPTEDDYAKVREALGEEKAKEFFAPATIVSEPDDGLTGQTNPQV